MLTTLNMQIRVGMSVGHSPEQRQHLPDMRKKEENITNEDRQEAKRRIEGSLAPDAGGSSAPRVVT